VVFLEWYEIKDNKDIDYLMNLFGSFHDSCMKELYMWTNTYVNEDLSMHVSSELDTNVRMLFQRQFSNPSAIEIVFHGVTQFHLVPSPINHGSITYDAKLVWHEGLFYCTDNYDCKPEDLPNGKDNWISAERVSWRDVSSWMGKESRYGVTKKE
jgi:hypothetical protein